MSCNESAVFKILSSKDSNKNQTGHTFLMQIAKKPIYNKYDCKPVQSDPMNLKDWKIMYLTHYNLEIKPFKSSSDPKFIWLGEKHKEALATFKYGIQENKGFLLLTGDVGTGKTTLINCFLNENDTDSIITSIPDPDLAIEDFFRLLSHEFGIDIDFETRDDINHRLQVAGSEKEIFNPEAQADKGTSRDAAEQAPGVGAGESAPFTRGHGAEPKAPRVGANDPELRSPHKSGRQNVFLWLPW
jgi:hypothetical protein